MKRRLTAATAAFLLVLLLAGTAQATSPPVTGTVVRDNTGWTCNTHVNLDLVRVTTPPGDGVRIGAGCTGRIGQVIVTGVRNGDGIKVQNAGVARDLVIGTPGVASRVTASGPSTDGTHQDCVQAMGGFNIVLNAVVFDCYGGGGGNFFVQRAGGGASTPTSVVCNGCAIGPRHPNAVNLGTSTGSGVRDSLVCRPTSGRNPFMTDTGAQQPVNTGNIVVASADARCANADTLAAWITGSSPPPPPDPDPVVCDQACVDAFMAEIDWLRDELDAAGANEGLLLAEIARLEGLLAQIAELAGTA